VLEGKGVHAPELDAFEPIMAHHGAALTRARAEASRRLVAELRGSFRRITGEARAIDAEYDPGGFEDAETLRRALQGSRERDRHRGHAQFGPHKDDLKIQLGGYDARVEASQGEHRAITLALKMAELACIAEARGVYPVLLLDDVSSELDVARTALLFEFLRESPGQILLTTTTPALIDTRGLSADERRDYHLESGVVREVSPP
jgi:DNA replication and repair protein RecF